MLEVRDLHKAFGGFTAISGVSLRVPARAIVAIIGPNGAGKSTFFNLITGHLVPDAGRVVLEGEDITGARPHSICRSGVGRSFQRANIFPRLTVFENVQAALIAARGEGTRFWRPARALRREETEAILGSVDLLDKAETVSGELSYGNQKQLELGLALAGNPKLLLLDEPTAGMSATETRDSIRLIAGLARERGLTLLFTEHDMEVVFSIAEQIAVLHQGRLIGLGAPSEIRRNAEVRRVYLGERS